MQASPDAVCDVSMDSIESYATLTACLPSPYFLVAADLVLASSVALHLPVHQPLG